MRVWCWVQAGLRTCLADRPWDGPSGYNDLSSLNNTSRSYEPLPKLK